MGCLVDFFANQGEKWLAWLGAKPTPSDLSSLSGAFYHSAIATPLITLFSNHDALKQMLISSKLIGNDTYPTKTLPSTMEA